MNSGRTIFAQRMDLLPLPEFRRCVERYQGDYKVQSFSCLDQFLSLAFAQMTYRESLRDIETCLRAHRSQLYHMGFRGGIARYRRCGWRGVDPSTGLRSDQTIRLTGPKSSRRYPAPLRRIHYFDAAKDLRLVFLTNNFQLQPLLIAQLYRARWQVELFFRRIKHHLHIRAFYGTSQSRQDASVGGDQRVCARGDLEKATPTGPELVQNPANSERHDFRKNLDFIDLFAIQRPKFPNRSLYPTGSVHLMMGQY